MSLHDKIMNIAVGHKGRQSIGKLLYNTGYKDARRDAAELAKQYDDLVDDLVGHIKRIREDQQNNDWQMMGVAIAEAAEYVSKLNLEN